MVSIWSSFFVYEAATRPSKLLLHKKANNQQTTQVNIRFKFLNDVIGREDLVNELKDLNFLLKFISKVNGMRILRGSY